MVDGIKTLKVLFEGRKVFRIPEYQRSYAWEEKQLNDFFDDYNNQKSDRKYFFGTILLQSSEDPSPTELIDIVDGQQRITTLIIFLRVALQYIKKDKKVLYETYIKYNNAIKLRLLNDDNEFFSTYILGDKPVLDEYIKTPSQKRLLKAKCFFEEKLSVLKPAAIRSIIDKIERSNVLTYSVTNKSEATLIFETTNDRGKELTNLEKLKSFLMYNIYLVSKDESDDLLTQIQDRFSSIYRECSEVEDKIEEDSVLLYHYIAFGKWDNKEYYDYLKRIKKEITDLVKNNQTNTARSIIDEWSQGLKETFAIVKSMFLRNSGYFFDICTFSHLATFFPLLIKAYKYDHTEQKKNFEEICRYCSIFNYRVFNIIGSRSDKGQQALYRLARDFSGAFDGLFGSLKNYTIQYGDEEKFLNCLKNKKFYVEYDAKERNYFFWKYENMLRKIQPKAAEITRETFSSTDSKTKFSIEHILPQHPTEQTCKVINAALLHDEIDESFSENYLHSIGNLTIDPLSANSSKGKADVAEKDSKYFKRAPFKSQNELEDFLDENNSWTHKSIEKRAEKLIDFALVEWCFYSLDDFIKKYSI